MVNLQHKLQKFIFNHMRHDVKIMNHAIFPIGQQSEETAEDQNFRVYRQYFAKSFRGEPATETN